MNTNKLGENMTDRIEELNLLIASYCFNTPWTNCNECEFDLPNEVWCKIIKMQDVLKDR